MSIPEFDLITIGAGSAGVAASRYAASLGARVAICEAGRVGGTCVLRGCVPKKLFMYASQFADAHVDAPGYGWARSDPEFDLARLTAAKRDETSRLEALYRGMLADAGVQVVAGHAQVHDAHTVSIDGANLRARRILVATGGRPSWPEMPGIELALTSDDMLELSTLPRRLLVLGSGYIATEFAGIFRGFGTEVAMAFRADHPLRGFDRDIRTRLGAAMRARGIALHPGYQPAELFREGQDIVCRASDGHELRADLVLNALGRTPNSAGMGLEQVGVLLEPRSGAVRVDAWSRTSVESIYAIGDVTDRLNLTPVAIAQARAFVDSEFGGTPRAVDHRLVATAVFSQPPVAAIGMGEEEAVLHGHRVEVFEADFRPMKNVLSGRGERTYQKLVVDAASERILGLHMIGADAPEIVQSLAVALTLGARKRDFDATMAVHPTAAEEFMLMRKSRR